MDGTQRLTRSKTSLKRSAVETLQNTFAKVQKLDPAALIEANIQHLRSLGYTVATPDGHVDTGTWRPSRVNAICMSFKDSDLNQSVDEKNLDHELDQFVAFMARSWYQSRAFDNIEVVVMATFGGPSEMPTCKFRRGRIHHVLVFGTRSYGCLN